MGLAEGVAGVVVLRAECLAVMELSSLGSFDVLGWKGSGGGVATLPPPDVLPYLALRMALCASRMPTVANTRESTSSARRSLLCVPEPLARLMPRSSDTR